MPHSPLTDVVRRQVVATFDRLNLARGEHLRETLLIRGGVYCGRRFEVPGAHAIWLLDETSIQFFRDDGRDLLLLESVRDVITVSRLAA
jgi:hypothetical protein